MSKEEILTMSGNKLKAEVAQRVMGIKVEYPFAEGYPYYLREDKDGRMKWDIVPNYPGDISDAWQVVENLEALGFYFKLDSWEIEFYASGADIGKNTVRFDVLTSRSVSEAICKAALLTRLEEAR